MSSIDLKSIPKSPGIYKYYNSKGEIIYIGKSVNLFSRVSSYFNGKSKLNFAKKKMVEQIDHIETIVVGNETESLILETTLIKKHSPKYNILMKDDKNYLYIKITDGDFPKILKTRIKNKSGTYFGPYINGAHVNNILKVIKKHFGYGCFGVHFFKDGSDYNLDKYLFKNNANAEVNSEEEIQAEYNKQIENIKNFIKGDFKEVITSLQMKMKQYASELRFEEANTLKEQIEGVQSLEISQNVRDTVQGNYNIINYIEKFDGFYIGLIEIRDSKITGYNNYEVNSKLGEEKEEILLRFIENKYSEEIESNPPNLPKIREEQDQKTPSINFMEELGVDYKITYILPYEISGLIEEIKTEVPRIGPKHDLLQFAYKNIYEFAYKKHLNSLSTKGFSKKTMQNLLKILGYKAINKDLVFECNDISHISGNYTVASRSIIENGKSNTSKYKKFRIKTLDEGKIDDFGSMKEIMTRRLKEIEKSGFVPDLIIIDGGKGQLSSVMKIIEEFPDFQGKEQLQIVSIAKREEELFLPGESNSILLDKESLELRLTQKIRDESHRFAITFNREKRIKAMKKNILESLPGFGLQTRKKLLKNFGSVDNLKNIDESELKKIITTKQFETLDNHGLV